MRRVSFLLQIQPTVGKGSWRFLLTGYSWMCSIPPQPTLKRSLVVSGWTRWLCCPALHRALWWAGHRGAGPGARVSPVALHRSGGGLQLAPAHSHWSSMGWGANGQLCWTEFLFLHDAFLTLFFPFSLFIPFLPPVPKSCGCLLLLVDDNVKYKPCDNQVYSSTKSLLRVTGHCFLAHGCFTTWKERYCFTTWGQPPLLNSILFLLFFQMKCILIWKMSQWDCSPLHTDLLSHHCCLNSSPCCHPRGPFWV